MFFRVLQMVWASLPSIVKYV